MRQRYEFFMVTKVLQRCELDEEAVVYKEIDECLENPELLIYDRETGMLVDVVEAKNKSDEEVALEAIEAIETYEKRGV
ncbi:hypothetical protein [Geobacillus subterraneus]|uniref:Uncharacterized protein n=1 Tax=Geobacillus subterraneus TaxID=129338 RepID=A0A679FQQ6_9BACL|nr:hypothetical protein [Geobacillus subterraneus]BBW98898.1 hypothetical protein GsuE55_37310 [Geobacillus subterraneus]